MDSIGNRISKNTVMTVSVTEGYLTYCGDHFIRCTNVESLCCPPKTKIILHVNSH